MKRVLIFTVVLTTLAGLCLAQYRPRSRSRRGAPRRIIQLTQPKTTGSKSFEEVLAERRSVRAFSREALTPEQISQLAWAGQGITDRQTGFRAAPSAGNTYPLTLYFVTAQGAFKYDPQEHSLTEVVNGDIRPAMAGAAQQAAIVDAPCSIVIAGTIRKVSRSFREHGKTFMLLEAGHVAQNLLLQAVALDLAAVPIGDFDKKSVTRACKFGQSEDPIYIVSVGNPVTEDVSETATRPGARAVTSEAAGKEAVLVVASSGFHDEELFGTMRVLESAGVSFAIASSRAGVLTGMGGGMAEAGMVLSQVRVDRFDAVVFIGGLGVSEYLSNTYAMSIAREADRRNKIVAGISTGPTVMANAGILRGVRATGLAEEAERLRLNGANYTATAVERDGNIVTASNPTATAQFARAIVEALAAQ